MTPNEQNDEWISLAELTEGSEKQIAWASRIRAEKLSDLRQQMAEMIAQPGPTATPESIAEGKAMFRRRYTELANRTDARFWIDNRLSDGLSILLHNTKA